MVLCTYLLKISLLKSVIQCRGELPVKELRERQQAIKEKQQKLTEESQLIYSKTIRSHLEDCFRLSNISYRKLSINQPIPIYFEKLDRSTSLYYYVSSTSEEIILSLVPGDDAEVRTSLTIFLYEELFTLERFQKSRQLMVDLYEGYKTLKKGRE